MSGIDKFATITIAVKDQDEALKWFSEKLGFEKRADMRGAGLRWLTVAPPHQNEVDFLLASWFPDRIGKNATCVVATRDCKGTFETLTTRGVHFTQPPTARPYGLEAVFEDLHANRYALVEARV